MPKMKTHRGAAKRFKVTKSGKVKRAKAYKSHILTKKSPKRKRNLRKAAMMPKAEERRIRKVLPYA
ncbi:50S ribosomal protein L35 [Crassaminicella indica]|uniref:Large ribosomal subunit protein bL35 n=1 Tax=Crassaminicella indica TaxID=2855394 RepID=A0ABX8RF40_9CLOT|nr:50S ribosomal protein L35 [Crassaminicella indica]QXM06355.1 50S ribosomal protein L35 [Crassaminicella indica]